MLASSKSMDKVLKMSKVSAATLNRWRNQYGAIKSEEANRLKRLDGEIARLKRLPVEADIDRAMLKKKLRGND